MPKDPAKPSIDAKYDFTCNMNIRGYTITSNKQLDFFGFENEVYTPAGVGSTESATIQCEGPIPSPGFGCGITNRQTAANRLTAQNNLRAELGFPVNPCKREKGEPPDQDLAHGGRRADGDRPPEHDRVLRVRAVPAPDRGVRARRVREAEEQEEVAGDTGLISQRRSRFGAAAVLRFRGFPGAHSVVIRVLHHLYSLVTL